MKNNEIDMIRGPLIMPIIRFALPIIATGVLQVLYNAADIIVVGQFASADSPAVAAIGATTALIGLIVGVFINLSVGINVALSMSLGRGDEKSSHEIVHSSIVLAIISGTILLLTGLFLSKQFLAWMSCPDEVIESSTLYLKIYFCGMPGSLVYNFGSAVLKSKGDSKRPLNILIVSGAANVVLNVFFVAVLGMDVDGVALATIISQYMSAAAVIAILRRQKGCCKLILTKLKLYGDKAWLIIKYGVPAGLASVMFNISNVFLQSSVNGFGIPDILTGVAAAGGIEALTTQAVMAIGQATVTFVGQNIGARNEKRIPRIFKTCSIMSVLTATVLGWLFILCGRFFIRLYAPNAPLEVVEYGLEKIRITQAFYFLCAFLDVQSSTLRGMGYPNLPTFVLMVFVCIFRIIWIFTIFPSYYSITGLYACYPVSWMLSIIVMMVALCIVGRKHKIDFLNRNREAHFE